MTKEAFLAVARNCRQLRVLNVADVTTVDCDVVDAFASYCRELENLCLTNTAVKDRGVASLAQLLNLSRLTLQRLEITDEPLLLVLRSCRNLRSLNISRCIAVTDAVCHAISVFAT